MAEFSLVHRTRPANSEDECHPALVLLHGRGADENDLFALADALDPRLFVLSARAPFSFPWGGYMWYDMPPGSVGQPDQATLDESLERLRSFLGEIEREYPIDGRQVVLAGFSQGAAMSAALAISEPRNFIGALIFSGYLAVDAELPLKPSEARGLAIFEAHGVFDEMIPIVWARQTRRYLEEAQVDLTYREYPVGHWIAPDELADAAVWLTGLLDRQKAE